MKLKESHFYDNDNIIELNKLVCQFLDDSFRNSPLTERLTISYKKNMEKIKPSYSFILYPDEHFLNMKEVREILGNFRDLKKQIMINQNDNEKNSFNPFFTDDSEDEEEEGEKGDNEDGVENENKYDYEYMDMNIWEIYHSLKTLKPMKCLPKRGVSLMSQKEKRILKEKSSMNTNKSISDNNNNIIINKKDKTYFENNKKKKRRNKYIKIIKEIFCNKLNDFRSEIVIYCINNTEILLNDNFENFVCFLEFFIALFTGIKTKYYIDELTNLNMDFYADEINLMNFAETFRYKVQFRIKDISLIYDSSSNTYKKRDNKIINNENFNINKYIEINELNKVQFENFDWNKVEYYPPYTNYIKELSANYRRFDSNDRIHFCKECENITNVKDCLNLQCDSSCFKLIDKERLIYKSLMTIISKESLEDCLIISDTLLIPNYSAINKNTTIFTLITNFLIPIETTESKKINKIFCDVFGEGIGFFFVWISHYIYWLIFPSLLGLIVYIILMRNIFNYELEISLIFTGIIILWGNYYVISWKKINKFYSHIWCIDDMEMKKDMIDESKRVSVNKINFMGIVMPLAMSYKEQLINFGILLLSILIKLFVMASNVIILTFKNHNFEFKNVYYNYLLNKYWKYITPIIIFILRELFSILSEKANIWLYSHQKFISESHRKKLLVQKKLIFEFFNYYFNLYYIAFIKDIVEKCLYDNCYKELEQQLIMIVISDTTVICVKFYINVISLRKQKRKFEKEIQLKYLNLENNSRKFKYYTRDIFEDGEIINYYLQIFLSFGYILQFGACCPISFILVLFSTIITRISLGISLRDIYYAQTQSEYTGLSIINQAQEIIAFIGILSNLFIIFYTNQSFVKIKTANKFFYIILTENIIIFITQFFEPFKLPNWFDYRHKIAIKYYRKYGIRKKRFSTQNNK